jgi:hypothetical protein
MNATEVKGISGGRWESCGPNAPGAIPLDDPKSPGANPYTDPPSWLAGTGFVRRESRAQSAEAVTLTAVSMPKGDDPDQTNAQWAMASPSGQLTITIHNPAAFGYVQPGLDYRVTIERIRGPRESA